MKGKTLSTKRFCIILLTIRNDSEAVSQLPQKDTIEEFINKKAKKIKPNLDFKKLEKEAEVPNLIDTILDQMKELKQNEYFNHYLENMEELFSIDELVGAHKDRTSIIIINSPRQDK